MTQVRERSSPTKKGIRISLTFECGVRRDTLYHPAFEGLPTQALQCVPIQELRVCVDGFSRFVGRGCLRAGRHGQDDGGQNESG
jgi:hypothetical protein